MRDFLDIQQQVVNRFGSKKSFEQMFDKSLIKPVNNYGLSDNDYLANMTWRIFCAGLKRSVVDAKWQGFETAFYHFHPLRVAMMSDDEMDALMDNREIIRHWGKIKSVRHNASLLVEKIEQHGSVGDWLATWSSDEIVELWIYLKKEGAQLGGNSAAYFLRISDIDTFVLTGDVVAALISQDIVDRHPTSQRDLRAVQQAFNQWQEQSGWSLKALSLLLAYSVNY